MIACSRELIDASAKLIGSSNHRYKRSQSTIRRSQRRILPRLAGASHREDSGSRQKAPGCAHSYITVELGRDREWAVAEANAMRSSMAGVIYVSTPYKRDGLPWAAALCTNCAEEAADTDGT